MTKPEEKLTKLLKKIADEQEYDENSIDVKAITSGGANYTTNLYLATLSAPAKPDLKLFAKVANLNEEVRANNEVISKVYLVESLFYTELTPHFQKLYQKNNVPEGDRLQIPKYYGHELTRLEEVMILENLEANGYENFDRMKTFDWEYAATAVQSLAKFHALGLAFRKENPEEFTNLVANFEVDFLKNQSATEAFMGEVIKNGCEALEPEYAMKLGQFFMSTERMVKITSLVVDQKTMLIHGDFRPSNLMHRERNGKLEIIPLDYQTLRLGNPLIDLFNFIMSGSDEEFRRDHQLRLVDRYYSELVTALKQLGVDAEEVYPQKRFEQDVVDFLPLGLVLALTTIAIVTVEPDAAPRLDGALASFTVKPNQLARERLAGIVRDYERWGIL